VRRVSVVGNSGAGKTTVARVLAERLGLEHVELDAIMHQPDWVELEPDEFRRRTTDRLDAAADGWVVCGNYSIVRDVVWTRADTVVWLDLSFLVVMGRVTRRTVRRVVTREELWNGNREPFSNLYAWDPTKNIIRWSWTNHAKYHERYAAAMADPTWSRLHFVHLRTAEQVDRWIARVESGP
jgi:adenylate kinase family enzyme